MNVEEARKAAHARGVEMRPADSGKIEGLFDQVDVADLIVAALDEAYPVGSAPSQRANRLAFEQWEAAKEEARRQVWEAFDAGTRGKPLKIIIQPAPVLMH